VRYHLQNPSGVPTCLVKPSLAINCGGLSDQGQWPLARRLSWGEVCATGTRGPIPKRDEQRRRRNKADTATTRIVPKSGPVEQPPPDFPALCLPRNTSVLVNGVS
jgi:hypothetical protein